MKNKKTSFKSIAWLLSLSMLLAWLAGMGFITIWNAEKYQSMLTSAGYQYVSRFANSYEIQSALNSIPTDGPMTEKNREAMERVMKWRIGWMSGDLSGDDLLIPGQEVPASASIIVYDAAGEEFLCTDKFLYVIYTNQENWEQNIESSDGNLWIDLENDPELSAEIEQIKEARKEFGLMMLDGALCFTGSMVGSRMIPSKVSYTNHLKPWKDDPKWQTVLERTPEEGSEQITVYAQRVDYHVPWESAPVTFKGNKYDDLTQMLRSTYDDATGFTGNLLQMYVFNSTFLTRLQDGYEKTEYSIQSVVSFSPLWVAMNVLVETYLVTFLIAAFAVFVTLRIIHRNLTHPIAVLNEHLAGHWMSFLKKQPKWREPLELEQRFTELTDTVKTQNDELRRKENEINRLNQALDYAKQAEENRRSMISAVAHELKTPLAVIHGYTEGLQENIAEDKKDQYLATILSESERMDKLVMEMLDLSRLEAGKVKLARDTFSLTELIQSVFDRLSREMEKKSLRLTFDLRCEGQIHADEGRMEQVILNLASNAVRYTPVGGHIRVRTEKKVGMVFFYMENDAAPFAEEELTKVWETFYRTDRARNGKGTGLDLAIVKNIIKLHGGTCYARNTQSGVEFSFHIPQI